MRLSCRQRRRITRFYGGPKRSWHPIRASSPDLPRSTSWSSLNHAVPYYSTPTALTRALRNGGPGRVPKRQHAAVYMLQPVNRQYTMVRVHISQKMEIKLELTHNKSQCAITSASISSFAPLSLGTIEHGNGCGRLYRRSAISWPTL